MFLIDDIDVRNVGCATISLVVILESDQFSTLLTLSLLQQRKCVRFLASWWVDWLGRASPNCRQ